MYFRGLIHKGIMYKTFIMENCYLFYLIRNLLKQNHCAAYGIVFLGVSRLERIIATFFHIFSPIPVKLQSHLFVPWMKMGIQKKDLHQRGSCSNRGSACRELCDVGWIPCHQTSFLHLQARRLVALMCKIVVAEARCWCRDGPT